METSIKVFRMFQKLVNAPSDQEADAAEDELRSYLKLSNRPSAESRAGYRKLAAALQAQGHMTAATFALLVAGGQVAPQRRSPEGSSQGLRP